jgi:integrase
LADLSLKSERECLQVRADPYFQRLSRGAFLGFRRGPNTWLVRYRGRDGKQQYLRLGEGLEYDEAKRKAQEWLAQPSGPGVRVVKRTTVRAALEAYLSNLCHHGRQDAAHAAQTRFRQVAFNDVIAEAELEQAKTQDFLQWRDRLLPGRKPRSVNRHVRSVVAGLNAAHRLGHVGNPSAWRLTPLADDVEGDGETAVFIDAAHRKSLIAAASSHAGLFLRGLELTGARPLELATATAGDFDGTKLRLAHRMGKPPKLRVRYVTLSPEGVKFFEERTHDRLPGAALLTEDGVTPWRRHMWCRCMRAAIAAHNKEARSNARIPTGASAYSFRHARIRELLQLHAVDPLTVAAQMGTSVAMIEKAYLRFIPSALVEKLSTLKEA